MSKVIGISIGFFIVTASIHAQPTAPIDRFPGAAAWGEVRHIQERMPAADFIVHPDGNELLFFGYNTSFQVYDLRFGRVTVDVSCDVGLHDATYSPDGQVLATAEWVGGVNLRNPKNGRVLATLKPDSELGAAAIRYLPDGKLAGYCWRSKAGAGSLMQEQVALWDPAEQRLKGWPVFERVETEGMIRRRFVGHGRYLLSVETTTKNRRTDSRSVALTDPTTNTTTPWLPLEVDDDCIDVTPDGHVYLVFNPHRAPRLVERATGRTLHELTGHAQYVNCGTFSKDGKLVATASGTTRRTLQGPLTPPKAGSPTEILLWDVTSGRVVATLRDSVKNHDYYRLSFGPGDKMIVAVTKPEEPGKKKLLGGDLMLWGKLPVQVPGVDPPKLGDAEPVVPSDRLDQLVRDLVASNRPTKQKVEAVYLAVLGRFPTANELARSPAVDADGLKKLVDALVSTAESREHIETLQKRTKR